MKTHRKKSTQTRVRSGQRAHIPADMLSAAMPMMPFYTRVLRSVPNLPLCDLMLLGEIVGVRRSGLGVFVSKLVVMAAADHPVQEDHETGCAFETSANP